MQVTVKYKALLSLFIAMAIGAGLSLATISCSSGCSRSHRGTIVYNRDCARYEVQIEGVTGTYQLENCPSSFLVTGKRVCVQYKLRGDFRKCPTCCEGTIATVTEITPYTAP
jgi:hypothetical protein